MISVLLLTVAFAVGVSFFCSLLEAALYAVPIPHIKHLAEEGRRSGKILERMKRDIGRPIAAILILNTIANTAGAAIAGAQAGQLWGERGLLMFSVAFTLLVLFLSEIIPKILGVLYCRQVAQALAVPLTVLINILRPLIWFTQFVSRALKGEHKRPLISEEEVLSIAAIGQEEGTLDQFEGSVITNVIGLDRTLVRDVLTPRVSVEKMAENTRLSDIREDLNDWKAHSGSSLRRR